MKPLYLLFVVLSVHFTAKSQTVGLLQRSDSSLDNGYVLFPPTNSTTTYLIDKCGKQIKTWSSTYRPGHSAYLLEDGNLLRTGTVGNVIFTGGGNGGIIEKIDWSNKVIWSYKISDPFKCQHHDIKALPNGNVLAIVWEAKSNTAAIDKGRNPASTSPTIWSEEILEIRPIGKDSGEIVWEWHLWDHLVQEFDPLKENFAPVINNPQLMDINYRAFPGLMDWIHLNSIDYNPDLDQILLSVLNTNEIWIIDHSTTTVQAASHTGGKAGKGGDFLYRWGNPQAYKNGGIADQKFFGQHNARWIEKGYPLGNQIMVFNNGAGRTGGIDSLYSTVEILNPPLSGFTYAPALPYGPSSPTWIYNKGNMYKYFATNISGAQPLANGNVLLCHGPMGLFTEITAAGNTVWKYVNPVTTTGITKQFASPTNNNVFRCTLYPASFSGFAGHLPLTPSSIIEDINTLSDSCDIKIVGIQNLGSQNELSVYPNPASLQVNIKLKSGTIQYEKLRIRNSFGCLVYEQDIPSKSSELSIGTNDFASGIYFIEIMGDDYYETHKVMISK